MRGAEPGGFAPSVSGPFAASLDGANGKPVPTSHDLRSSFLTWLANYANNGLGVKPHVLMRIAGHSDLAVTMKYYVGVTDEDLASAVNSLYMDLSEQVGAFRRGAGRGRGLGGLVPAGH